MKKTPKISFIHALKRIKQAGLNEPAGDLKLKQDFSDTEELGERIKKILHLKENINQKPENMTFLVLYDIENNKIRTQIAKYLIKEGCIRIQKSVYMAHLPRKKYREIHKTLKEVQEMYENTDSILFIPLPSDSLNAMKVLGQQIEFDFILDNKNTLFF